MTDGNIPINFPLFNPVVKFYDPLNLLYMLFSLIKKFRIGEINVKKCNL